MKTSVLVDLSPNRLKKYRAVVGSKEDGCKLTATGVVVTVVVVAIFTIDVQCLQTVVWRVASIHVHLRDTVNRLTYNCKIA